MSNVVIDSLFYFHVLVNLREQKKIAIPNII